MDFERMSDKLKGIFQKALQLVINNKNVEIDLSHFLYALITTDDIKNIFISLKLDYNKVLSIIDNHISSLATSSDANRNPNINGYIVNAYNEASNTASKRGSKYISMFDMLVPSLYNDSSLSKELTKYLCSKKELEKNNR